MKRIYYILSVIINAASLIVFNDSINISESSVTPIIIIIIITLNGYFFNNMSIDDQKNMNTAYINGNGLNSDESIQLCRYMGNTLYMMIPVAVPSIFFFGTGLKIALALGALFMGYIIGGTAYKIKNHEKIKERLKAEDEQLKVQNKAEEMGRFK